MLIAPDIPVYNDQILSQPVKYQQLISQIGASNLVMECGELRIPCYMG